MGEEQKAIEDFNRAIELKPDSDYARAFYNLGLSHFKLNNYRKALENFTKFINFGNNDENAYSKRALVNFSLNNYQEAIEDYSHAIELNPHNADSYKMRGISYLQQSMKPAMIDLHKAAIIHQEQGDMDDYESVQEIINFINLINKT